MLEERVKDARAFLVSSRYSFQEYPKPLLKILAYFTSVLQCYTETADKKEHAEDKRHRRGQGENYSKKDRSQNDA